MAGRKAVGDHVTKTVSGALATAVVFVIIKWALRKSGKGGLANDF